jgi:hypothetical protein
MDDMFFETGSDVPSAASQLSASFEGARTADS